MKKKMNLNKSTKSTLITIGMVGVAYIVMTILTNAGVLSSLMKGLLVPLCIYAIIAVALNLTVGILGELSLGHAGFMCVGAFSSAFFSLCFKETMAAGPRFLAAIIIGAVVSALFGLLIGIPVLRLQGDYLAIVTLAFGEIIKNVVSNMYVGLDEKGLHMSLTNMKFNLAEGGKMILDGPIGATGIRRISSFPMGFALILLTLFVVLNLINSKEGRAIKAVRDNRIAAESVGINVTAFRMKAFVVSAALAGMAGALYGLNMSSIAASKFNFHTSINILVFVVLGGMGNILGSVISATVLYILPEAMRQLEDYRMILYAVVLILVMLFTWSPKFKEKLAVLSQKTSKMFRKKGGA